MHERMFITCPLSEQSARPTSVTSATSCHLFEDRVTASTTTKSARLRPASRTDGRGQHGGPNVTGGARRTTAAADDPPSYFDLKRSGRVVVAGLR
jgi:hypothetical protein